MNQHTDNSWTRSIPWGGYQQGGPTYAVAGQPLQHAPAHAMAPYVGQQRPMLGMLGLTLLGLGIFGGAGALVGWLVGGSQKSALVGAILGLTAPQVASSMITMREGSPQ